MATRQQSLGRTVLPAPAPSVASGAPRPTSLRRKAMRGGLGRTLLTAFLVLAITPLSVMSLYAINRTQQESQQRQSQQLTLAAEGYRTHLLAEVQRLQQALRYEEATPRWALDAAGEPLAVSPPLPEWVEPSRTTSMQAGGDPVQLWVPAQVGRRWRAALLPVADTLGAFQLPDNLSGIQLYVEQGEEYLSLEPRSAPPSPLLQQVDGEPERIVTQHLGERTDALLVSRAPLGKLALLLVLPETKLITIADTLAAALVAAALVAALVTTIGAAVITRSITQPLYELTRTAVQIARGDLSQRAQVRQENELGVLALAFNTMADQLTETLDTLEERVETRTEALRRANAQIQERARQLELSAELGALLSAIHELDALLVQATRLIASSFDYRDTAIWLVGRRPEQGPGLSLRASMRPELAEGPEGAQAQQLAHSVLAEGSPQASDDRQQLALPLRVGDNLIGVLLLSQHGPFQREDQSHLQILADTLTIAIENARASEMERTAMDKLQHIEERRQAFLGEMSQELSTALNSIIGFSSLMLKEVEGPLTDMQRSDLTYINRNGNHLLSLLDVLLDVLNEEGRHLPAPPREESNVQGEGEA